MNIVKFAHADDLVDLMQRKYSIYFQKDGVDAFTAYDPEAVIGYHIGKDFIRVLQKKDGEGAELLKFEVGKFPVFINCYEITREYGGPEEGGWWYNNRNCYKTIAIVISDPDFYYSLLNEVKKTHQWEGRLSSMSGGSVGEVRIELIPGETRTTEIPFYC